MTPKERAKDARLRREYNLTLEEYKRILKFQNNACAICKRPSSTMRMQPAVDHCHFSGLVRGLLCMTCNRALGKFQDSIIKLKAAVAYLESPPTIAALGREVLAAPGRVGTKLRARRIKKMKKRNKDEEIE